MAKFEATIVRVIRITGSFTFSAKNEEEAEEKAAELANRAMREWDVTWSVESMAEIKRPLDVEWQSESDDLEDGPTVTEL
jgi:hypothetical protein